MEHIIGFIGLGNLGTPIAMNIVGSGYALSVYNRTASKIKPLVDKGATESESVAALARRCNIIFTMVSDDEALLQICEGPEGLIAHLSPGSIHVSMSTISPDTAERLDKTHREYLQHYLAAPVFGRPDAATARKLNFAISGPEAIRKEIEPLLKAAGAAAVWHFGHDITAANKIKLCGNFLIAAALQAIGESVALAGNSGIDAMAMWDMFGKTLFNTPVYHNYSKIILEERFEPAAFSAKLGLKDMNLVKQLAEAAGQAMPLASLLANQYESLINSDRAEIDWSAVAQANA